jgi:hypothetical protein
MVAQGPFGRLYDSLRAGQITRREFIEHSTALGVAGAVAIFCANAAQAAASGGSQNGFAFYAQSNTAGTGKAPDAGTQNQKRGAGPELRLIQWQAASIAVPHTATGTKDYLASCIVLEPLMHYLEDGSLIPNLVKRVPSVENGLLAKDLSTVTFELLPDIKWSDGQPFTAKDVVFTWQWITFEGNASVSVGVWQAISKAEAKDDHTVVCTFASPAANWARGPSNHSTTPRGVIEARRWVRTCATRTTRSALRVTGRPARQAPMVFVDTPSSRPRSPAPAAGSAAKTKSAAARGSSSASCSRRRPTRRTTSPTISAANSIAPPGSAPSGAASIARRSPTENSNMRPAS